jgi:uncharacterized protein (DUF3084 family)
MITANDPIRNIQSRIDELEKTISEKGEQIRARTRQLKEDMEEELSPMELIRKHPLEATGISFVTGIVAGRMIRTIVAPARNPVTVQPQPQAAPQAAQVKQTSPIAVAAGAIGAELLHTAKDLTIAWIKTRVSEKKDKA